MGDIDGMVHAIAAIADRPHYNAYLALAVFRGDLPNGKKGSQEDILAVLGLVADFDDAEALRWAERLPIPPNYVLETSVGRLQTFHFFATPQQPGEAKPIAECLKAYAKCDHGTADLSHVWRIPGCPNWPNSRKIAGSISREPQLVKVILPWDDLAVSRADLAAALSSPKPNGHGTANVSPTEPKAGTNGTGSADFDSTTAHADRPAGAGDAAADALVEAVVKALPKRLRDRITQPASGDRSRNLFFVIKSLIARDLDDGTIKAIVEHHPLGVGEKYAERPDLDREIVRIRTKSSRCESAEADAATARGTGRPVIKVRGGTLPTVVDLAEAALIDRDPEIYEFGDELVRLAMAIRIGNDRVTADLRLVTIGINELIERMTKAADFQRFDKRSEEFVSIDCPKHVAATYLERIGKRRLRKVTAITTAPCSSRTELSSTTQVLTTRPASCSILGVLLSQYIDIATDFQTASADDKRRYLHPEFREALLVVADEAGNINSRRLGKWLNANKAKVVNKLRIINDGILEGVARYRVQHFVEGRWE